MSNFFDTPRPASVGAPAVPPVQAMPSGAPGPRKLELTDPKLTIEQNIIHTALHKAFEIDPSIKDFIIHQDEQIRVACARGKLPISEILNCPALEAPISEQAIMKFVTVYLMGPATSADQVKANHDTLKKKMEVRSSYSDSMRLNWGSKIRISMFRQAKGRLALVGRVSSLLVTPLDKVGMPHQAVSAIRAAQRGLIIITGPMSSGKTATAQSILQMRNLSTTAHIMTVEDPIETTLKSEKCLITTKEVGSDVGSFLEGLTDALRQAVDVLLIGEMRDADTIKAAVSAAGSGMLVIATVHGDTCAGALSRMMSMLGDEAPGYWKVLSTSLIAVIRQALVATADGTSWQVAADALINTDKVSQLLSKGDGSQLEQFATGPTKSEEWISMNDTLKMLIANKRITLAEARRESTDVKSLPPR